MGILNRFQPKISDELILIIGISSAVSFPSINKLENKIARQY
jgi:hypothetical protein